MKFILTICHYHIYIDAVKKILLEPERGRYAKHAAIQNRKLRREVTTISRMTHKNIVRYYQAWVEGNDRKFSNDESNLDVYDAASLSEENVSGEDIQSDLISRNSVSSKSGWWNISGKESMDVSNEGSSFTESSDSTLGDNALLDKVTFFPNNGLWPVSRLVMSSCTNSMFANRISFLRFIRISLQII